jgi:hypothetical protein
MIKSLIYLALSTLLFFGFNSCDNNAQQTPFIKQEPKKVQEPVSIEAPYKIYAPKIAADINFCSEKTPIEQSVIYEKLDRELLVNMYWQSQTFLFIKRAHKWFPIIEPILKKNNIPDDFKYLAVIESGLMNVVSPSGAKGFWQFMPKTAKGLNLEVNEFVDERYELKLATEAACSYLNDAYKKFNNWTLAAASYNMGKAGLERRLSEQEVSSYYDLLLNQETGRYVYRILAVKEILSSPEKYGFNFDEEDLYSIPKHEVIKVDSSITDLVQFSKSLVINYSDLKTLNPWLRDKSLPNEQHKIYSIMIMSKEQ